MNNNSGKTKIACERDNRGGCFKHTEFNINNEKNNN